MKKKIQFLLILLLGFTNYIQAESNNFTYPEIKTLLKQHCLECSHPSLEKYQQTVNALDNFVENSNKGLFYRQSLNLLFDSLFHFTLAFAHEEDSIKRLIDQQYKIAVYSLESQYNIMDIRFFDRKKKKIFIKLIQKYQTKQSIVSYYEGMFSKLSKRQKQILEKKLKGMSYNEYIRNYQQLQNIQEIPPTSAKLLKRIKFLKITNFDKKILESYSSYLYDLKDMTISKEEKLILAKLLVSYVKRFHLSINRIKELRKSVIILRYTNNIGIPLKYLSDILWWGEVRSFENKTAQLQFLSNQMLSIRKLDALKMLVELGEVEMVEKWLKKLSFENSETIFNLAIRQAKLRKATLEKNSNLAKLINKEYKHSIAEIIQQKQQDNPIYQQHIQWIIIQLGTHRENNKFKNILENLVQDNLYYNKQEIKKLSLKEKHQLSEELEMKFEISSNAQFVLNPTDEE